MPRTNRTIARDSVLRPAPAPPAEPHRPRQGVTADSTTTRQTALWLNDEELEWLDDRVRDIRQGGWRGITRSALLRALIRAAMDKDLALAGVSGEAELIDHLKRSSAQ